MASISSHSKTVDQSTVFSNNSILVRILDKKGGGGGKIIYRSPLFKGFSMPSSSLNVPLKGRSWTGTVPGPQSHLMRFYSTMLVSQSETIWYCASRSGPWQS